MAERRKLPRSDFAVPSMAPGPGSYPIEDAVHRRDALSRSSGKPVAHAVRAAVKRKSGPPTRKWQDVANQMLGGRR